MRHRIAFCVASALAAMAGCAGVLGLEDRHLESGDVPEAGALDAPTIDGMSSGGGDGGVQVDSAEPPGPCNPPGALVYEFDTDVGGRGYLTDADIPDARNPRPRFYLLSPNYPLEGSVTFFAQLNPQGDYLVSPHDAGEDDGAYAIVEALPNMFAADAGLPVPPNAIPFYRFFQIDGGTAHRLFGVGESTDRWNSDNHTWYACPLK